MSRKTFIIGGNPQAHEYNIKLLRQHFAGLDKTKPWKITVENYVRRRTNEQNALYWKWLDIIANDTGNIPSDVHEYCLSEFCPLKTKTTVLGKALDERSTKLLTTSEFSTYMDRVQAWANQFLHSPLPLPDDEGRT